MPRVWVPVLLSGLATLFVALPLAVGAAPHPTPIAPKRLVVDSVTAPVLSIDQATTAVEIVLVPDGDYVPVHPDSLDLGDDATVPSETTGPEPDGP